MPAVPEDPKPWKPYDWPDDEVPVLGFTAMPSARHSKDLATWVTKGNNCPACNALKGRTYPLGYWQATVLPGFHDHCDCRLVVAKSGVEESPHDLWGTDPAWYSAGWTVGTYFNYPYGTNTNWTLGTYLIYMFKRFQDFFNGRQEWWKLDGDAYSGFDNLYPVFISQSGFTSAGWTMMDSNNNVSIYRNPFMDFMGISYPTGFYHNYKLRVYGLTSVGLGFNSLIYPNKKITGVSLPWETSNKALPNPKIDLVRARNR